MGRYIDCGEDLVYKYALNQPSNLYLIHDMLGIGRLNHYTTDESHGNGCDVLLLTKQNIKELKNYFDLRVKQIERDKKMGFSDITSGEANFQRMINHLIFHAESHPDKDVYAFDSES